MKGYGLMKRFLEYWYWAGRWGIQKKFINVKGSTIPEHLKHPQAFELYNNTPEIFIEDYLEEGGIQLDTDLRYYSADSDEDGSVRLYELYVLNLLCKSIKPKQVLELGTYKGRSAVNMALNLSDESRVYSVDIEDFKPLDLPDLPNLEFIIEDSKTLDFTIFNPNLVFIDASHEYEDVVRDSLNIKHNYRDCYVVWHDYSLMNLGCVKAINDIFFGERITRVAGTSVVVYKI